MRDLDDMARRVAQFGAAGLTRAEAEHYVELLRAAEELRTAEAKLDYVCDAREPYLVIETAMDARQAAIDAVIAAVAALEREEAGVG